MKGNKMIDKASHYILILSNKIDMLEKKKDKLDTIKDKWEIYLINRMIEYRKKKIERLKNCNDECEAMSIYLDE